VVTLCESCRRGTPVFGAASESACIHEYARIFRAHRRKVDPRAWKTRAVQAAKRPARAQPPDPAIAVWRARCDAADAASAARAEEDIAAVRASVGATAPADDTPAR
jgi:hypothetical protein